MRAKILLTCLAALLRLPSAFASLPDDEAWLAQRFADLYAAVSDSARQRANAAISERLSGTLTQDGAFDYPFASLTRMGKIMSDDATLRAFSWNYRQDNGTYGYECFFLWRKKGKERVYHLSTNKGTKPDNNVQYNANDWYGSLYYSIFAIRGDYYLLGYSTCNDITKLKVIDVLSIRGDDMSLGAPVFGEGKKARLREVFEYSAKAQMTLTYDPDGNRFVFDHLSPSEPALKGMYQFYGPDFSYESLTLKKKRWIRNDDIDIKNPLP